MNQGTFCAFVDVSRGAVMKLERLKDFVDAIVKIGYNALTLYSEDLMEIDGEPFMGYLRGRYTKQELKELNAYAKSKGIKLIPCIETLGHVEHIFRWKEYLPIRDIDNILLCDNERTYQLIDNIMATCRECFDCREISVGLDEATMLGLGKYLKLHGYTNHFEILLRHIKKVRDIAAKYDFSILIDSDLFFSMACGDYYPSNPTNVISEEIAESMPDDVEIVYWDYFHKSEFMNKMIKEHRKFNRPLWYFASVMSWNGYTPHNYTTFPYLEEQMKACRENNLNNIMICDFGDDGNENTAFTSLPAYFYARRAYEGKTDWETLNHEYKELFGLALEEACRADLPSNFLGEVRNFYCVKPLLFNDPFTPIYNDLLDILPDDLANRYDIYAEQLDEISDNPDFGYIFKAQAALCRLMKSKIWLSDKTRKAYTTGERKAIYGIIPMYEEAIRRIDEYYLALRNYWMHDNKGNGFEIQAIRFGGLKQRLTDCMWMLKDYADGKTERLHELDESLLKFNKLENLKDNRYGQAVSVNEISFFHY